MARVHVTADAEILEAIREGETRASVIVARTGRDYRLIDRRLQSLRRRGLIEYADGGWRITEDGDDA
jgi:predicted transcriptional regulator